MLIVDAHHGGTEMIELTIETQNELDSVVPTTAVIPENEVSELEKTPLPEAPAGIMDLYLLQRQAMEGRAV